MISPALFIAIFLPLALSEFIIPSEGPRLSLMAGQVQEIQYKTSFSTYSIALWQQFTGSARLGPILYQTTNGPDYKFDWLVQPYTSDLMASNVFFLWLFEGDPSQQGNQSARNSFSSAFFNMSTADDTEPSSTTTTLPPSISTTSSTTPAVATLTSLPEVELPAGSNSSTISESSSTSGELSTGAIAGIAVGAGVIGLGIIVGMFFFVRYRSKVKELEDLRNQNHQQQNYYDPPACATHREGDLHHASSISQNIVEMPVYNYHRTAYDRSELD